MKTEVKINKKVKVGLPFSKAYKSKTPKKIKTASEILVFTGSAITIIAATFSPPGWVIMAGGLATLSGRFLLKCFAEND